MKFDKTLYLWTILIILFLSAFDRAAQDPVILKLITQLRKWTDQAPIEKVYLQLDKPYYAAGDEVWFKAYLTIGGHHLLSALSGTLNVELINEQDSVKSWIKLPVIQGSTWGDFKLAETLPAGNYRIRAYTNWMRNAGSAYYFDKVLIVTNSPADSIFTRVVYRNQAFKTSSKLTATLFYTNAAGIPYTGKKVNYAIMYDGKSVSRGSAISDSTGSITLAFTRPKNAKEKGVIISNLKINTNTAFDKTIIINDENKPADIQFFPEGGNLVNGLNSKVAFKAVGPDGLGMMVKGKITDEAGREITSFTAQHAGMGSFRLIPQAGKVYKAEITYPENARTVIKLPGTQRTGYILSINNQPKDHLELSVSGTNDLLNTGNIYVVGQSGGELYYIGQSDGSGTGFKASIPKSRFPAGIVQFTLFSGAAEPLNERICFIQHTDSLLKLEVRNDKSVSAPREKVKMELNARFLGLPVQGTFSATVLDEGHLPFSESAETTILSYLLLSSDLKGYIEAPNYYFDDPGDQTAADLDVLMLTQGYRRFEWKSLLAGQYPEPVYEPEKLINLYGKAFTSGGHPAAGAKITLMSSATLNPFLLDTLTDEQGLFTFKNLLLEDSVHFVLKAISRNGDNTLTLRMITNEDPETKNDALSTITFKNDYKPFVSYLNASAKLYDVENRFGLGEHAIFLKEVAIKGQKTVRPGLEHSSNRNGAGNADQVITSDDLEKRACLNLDDCLNGMLAGVVFRDGHPFSTRGAIGDGNSPTPMLIILDGIPQDNALEKDFLGTIAVHDVAAIEVLRNPGYLSIYGLRGGNGVLIITTKRGDNNSQSASQPGMNVYSPKGYYRAREFYAPQYGDPKTNNTIADLRTTIHWKPNITTNQTGHASFEYYNAGSPGTYRVIVEGIDGEGHIGRTLWRYQVK